MSVGFHLLHIMTRFNLICPRSYFRTRSLWKFVYPRKARILLLIRAFYIKNGSHIVSRFDAVVCRCKNEEHFNNPMRKFRGFPIGKVLQFFCDSRIACPSDLEALTEWAQRSFGSDYLLETLLSRSMVEESN